MARKPGNSLGVLLSGLRSGLLIIGIWINRARFDRGIFCLAGIPIDVISSFFCSLNNLSCSPRLGFFLLSSLLLLSCQGCGNLGFFLLSSSPLLLCQGSYSC